jgi:hypothetical protein
VNELASSHGIGPSEIRDVYIQGWEAAASHLLADGVLSVDEEHHLAEFMDHFGLSQAELDRHGMHSKVAKAAVLWDLMQGKLPQRIKVAGGLPFSLLKTEHLIWLFTDVGYLEDQVRREYVGRSSGLSIRLAKGVYYRVGAFRGHPVTKTDRVHVDTGLLWVTNKHLYFAGPLKSFRVRRDKIVSIMPFSDGAGIVRNAASAKPQVFVTGDGWFTVNLLADAAQV